MENANNIKTDLNLLDEYCEDCSGFIPPKLFNKIRDRGLLWVINNMKLSNVAERKAYVRAKLASVGRYIGNPEIEAIADKIERIKELQKKFACMNPADIDKTIPVLNEILMWSEEIKDYYKTSFK